MKEQTGFNYVMATAGLLWILAVVGGCAGTYYSAMEKVGVHKREIMQERVEKARDAQSDAQEEFTSALERFESVVTLENSDLKTAYEDTQDGYERSKKAAEEVTERINRVEDVADALFAEWEMELEEYNSAELKRLSRQKITETRTRYRQMISTMRKAEASMAPVLTTFHDNVLFLKHNLNAQAIGSLKGEFSRLQQQIRNLVARMEQAISSSNAFLSELQ